MAHRHDVYRYGKDFKYIEHEYKCAGRFGAKGEKREKRRRATPEQMAKQNQWKREKLIRRLIRSNFEYGDLWVTLKFPKDTRLTAEEMLDVRDKFFRAVRTAYKKRGQVLKYIYRIEIGKHGGPHFHVVLNRLPEGTAKVVQEIWKKFGKYLNYTPLYEEGDFTNLAFYIVKPIDEEMDGQLTLWGTEEEKKVFMKYGRSRNLAVPEPEQKEYKHRTIRKLVENGPEPQEGYYIDQDSIKYGVNPFTGMTYFYYTEVKLPDKPKWAKGDSGG